MLPHRRRRRRALAWRVVVPPGRRRRALPFLPRRRSRVSSRARRPSRVLLQVRGPILCQRSHPPRLRRARRRRRPLLPLGRLLRPAALRRSTPASSPRASSVLLEPSLRPTRTFQLPNRPRRPPPPLRLSLKLRSPTLRLQLPMRRRRLPPPLPRRLRPAANPTLPSLSTACLGNPPPSSSIQRSRPSPVAVEGAAAFPCVERGAVRAAA